MASLPSDGKKDTDATWTKKHGKSYFGYKRSVNVDKQHKFIQMGLVACMIGFSFRYSHWPDGISMGGFNEPDQ